MTLTFRPYQDDDLRLLQDCIMAWRKQAPDGTYGHPGDIPHRLYNGNKGIMPISDITRIYMHGDTVAALLLAYPRYPGMDIFINPDFRQQYDLIRPVVDDGHQIIRSYLDTHDKADKAVEIDCFHSDKALQNLLSEAGFTEREHYITLTRRKLENLENVQLPDGFSIRTVTLDDAEQLATVHSKSFGSSWTAEIYRDEVMLKPGYKPEREFVVVAPDGNFAAFTVTWLDEVNKVGLFEPVGTSEDYRRMGLARTLMSHVLREMKEQGMIEAEVCHATNNPASTALYRGLGFEECHHLYTWEKQVNKET